MNLEKCIFPVVVFFLGGGNWVLFFFVSVIRFAVARWDNTIHNFFYSIEKVVVVRNLGAGT